ncbi:MAG TPA: aminotransferase class I/II-fold pyridoxal phosphate-dependent enzyme [Myxococcales bacterium]|nr:aminotransferase class I/II-fold pyridoxal phosphate-dependent enzyme [Myxococcales bacterium]
MNRPPESFVRATVRPLKAYGPPRDPAKVALHLNESPSDVADELKKALADEFAAMDWSRYPITEGSKLAADVADACGVDPASVLVGNGSNELLQLLLLACVEPGDKVVVVAPSFALYGLQAAAMGARVVEVPLRSGESFRFPVGELIAHSRDAKLVLIGSPNNPTGTVLSLLQLEELASGVPCLLGIDEAYREFCGQDFAPPLARHERLVLFRTFSKAYAGASLRVGYMLAAPALCAELRKVQLPYNLSTPACLIARALVKRPEIVAGRALLVARERDRVATAMREMGFKVYPSGANFLLFDADQRLHAKLFERGVLIRAYPALGALRVSIGAPELNDAFLSELARCR